MKKIELIREESTSECIRGILKIDGVIECCTLERPWLDNKRNVSAIPAGTYIAEPYTSKKFGKTFIIKDVPGRSGILIHSGNTAKDTEGCILTGEGFSIINGAKAVCNSKAALNRLLDKVTEPFEIIIKNS